MKPGRDIFHDPDRGVRPRFHAAGMGAVAWADWPAQQQVTTPAFYGPVPLVLGPSSWGFGVGFIRTEVWSVMK